MSGPSNETEAEALQRRQVEALEAIAKALEIVSQVLENAGNPHTGCIDVMAHRPDDDNR